MRVIFFTGYLSTTTVKLSDFIRWADECSGPENAHISVAEEDKIFAWIVQNSEGVYWYEPDSRLCVYEGPGNCFLSKPDLLPPPLKDGGVRVLVAEGEFGVFLGAQAFEEYSQNEASWIAATGGVYDDLVNHGFLCHHKVLQEKWTSDYL